MRRSGRTFFVIFLGFGMGEIEEGTFLVVTKNQFSSQLSEQKKSPLIPKHDLRQQRLSKKSSGLRSMKNRWKISSAWSNNTTINLSSVSQRNDRTRSPNNVRSTKKRKNCCINKPGRLQSTRWWFSGIHEDVKCHHFILQSILTVIHDLNFTSIVNLLKSPSLENFPFPKKLDQP